MLNTMQNNLETDIENLLKQREMIEKFLEKIESKETEDEILPEFDLMY